MTIKLRLNPKNRSMTREEWKEADRWRRRIQREMQPYEEEIITRSADKMFNLFMFGQTELDGLDGRLKN